MRVGDHDFDNPTPALIEFDVEFFIIHEDYTGSGSGGSDIALIKVSYTGSRSGENVKVELLAARDITLELAVMDVIKASY